MVTQHSSRPRGFTLIELLVVLSIIGILVALLVPAIYAARISALNFRISSEIAQLSQGLDEYKNTFGDFPPNLTNEALLRRHLSKRQRIAPAQVNLFVTFLEGGGGKPM
ncbi:MAG TPA: prepilin-type N-terminal cleavage/methylation domain-containing protein, partial [Pirellulaceae bacterium]|nr:prepilin-type N-terminal cleavage/methylation domain-containing protein [Pirellulaceae bacterium]